MKRIRFVVGKDGKVNYETQGFQGEACLLEAQRILQTMRDEFGVDIDVEAIQRTPEYYAAGQKRRVRT